MSQENPVDELPADLVEAIPPNALGVARDWWASLDDAKRRQVAGLWDERLEVRFFTPQADESGAVDSWDCVPDVTGGKYVPSDDARGQGEWGPGYFEHLLQHPELVLAWEPEQRVFHIGCTRHAAARACIWQGRVPADFRCPVDSETCPLIPLRGATLMKRAR